MFEFTCNLLDKPDSHVIVGEKQCRKIRKWKTYKHKEGFTYMVDVTADKINPKIAA